MTVDWNYKTQAYRAIVWRDCKHKAAEDLQAEVIASRREAAEYREHQHFGPGRIRDLELALEKIYE